MTSLQIGKMDSAHTHDHTHDHNHKHDHDHGHVHTHVFDPEAAVQRFRLNKGRNPTADEEHQLREHGHTHEHMEHAGEFEQREKVKHGRDYSTRGFTVGIGGPVGSG